MVILNSRKIWLAKTVGFVVVLSMLPSPLEACEPSHLTGRVKSMTLSEVIIDAATNKIAGVRQVLRMEISKDGSVAETTVGVPGASGGLPKKVTTYFEGGRPARATETVDGKTVTSMKCSYDTQGRLIESDTGSEFTEFRRIEAYEYGQGLVRRRTTSFPGGRSVTTQTLDANGRVVKEVTADGAGLAVQRTSQITYDGKRKEVCEVSPPDPVRHCVTTIHDDHGNEIEIIAEGRTEKMSLEYDSVGNWISKRKSFVGITGVEVVTIERRDIEYW